MEVTYTDFVFQTDSEIVQNEFKKENYLIEYNNEALEKKLCVIYFSSNNIYYPNTEENFKRKIVEQNFYEMYQTRINSAYKHIFVRDIYKQWYIEGINSRICTPELLFEFLQKETQGYAIITIGSSAGGYAAVLYGSLLSAERVFSFNGQFEIKSLLKTSNKQTDPLLFRNSESALACYFDLKNFIKEAHVIYYFSSMGSEWDNLQYEHIKDTQSVKPILFKTAHHGVPFVKSALPIVINFESKDLDNLVGKKLNPLWFSIRMAGLKKTFSSIYVKLIKKRKWL
ncbi:hypothetical protein FHS57_003619 [Runella defluvii]|uniref:Alpha/beta hydrolase n=1 Tax=Runella defluvii TaxID=370973 RepID=A0A7W6ERE6_9BACT|nr:hypothetical protein [Runella defluvii]MBB3839610.1 hypothetical protein [Runella defluvii]